MARDASPLAVPEGGFRRIAVLRLSSIGDIVLTLTMVHALREAFPATELHYWVKEEYQDLVRFDPAITHVRSTRKADDTGVPRISQTESCPDQP